MADIIIGNVKGPQGETGPQGPSGAPGAAATINVGTVTTTVYGNPAQVTNSGTASAAVLDFVIPQGAPGSEVTDVSSLTVDSITETAASFPVPAVGEVMSVVLGKIVKFFGDTVTALGNKFDKANVYNGLDKTADGFALDARQGKALNDAIINGRFYRNDATIADFQTWCATLDNAIPYPVYFGQSLCNVLTGISGTFLVGTMVLTNNKGTARMLIGNGVAGIKSQVFAITVNLSTGAITTSRLLSDDAMDGVGSAGISATDGISTSTNLTPSTNRTLGSVTVDRGTYNFEAYVRFTSAPANTRLIWFIGGSSAPANTSNGIHFEDFGSQAISSTRGMTFSRTLRVNADSTTIYFVVATTTACTVDVSRLTAYKIAVYQA